MRTNLFSSRIIIVIILIFLNSIIGYSQSITWYRTWGLSSRGERGQRVVQTYDGGYALLAEISLASKNGVYYSLLKYDSIGNLLWTNIIVDSSNKQLWEMQQTNDSGFIFAGWSSGALLIKTDKNGNLKWQKNYTNLNAGTRFGCVTQTNDNGYMATGSYTDYANPSGKAIIVKVDTGGSVQWERQYMDSLFNGFAGVLQIDSTYYITGYTQKIHPTYYYALLKKIDYYGNVIWTRVYNRDNGTDYIFQIKDGSLMIGGSNVNSQLPFLSKFDTTGNLKWAHTYVPDMYCYYMCKDIFDNIIITGSRSIEKTIGILRVDTGGTVVKTKDFSFSGCSTISPDCIKPTNDTGFIIAGSVGYYFPDESNTLIIKVDSAFNSPVIIGIKNIGVAVTDKFELYQNYPNPFNSTTVLKFSIPGNGYVILSIYDILGKEVFSNKKYFKNGLYEQKLNFDVLNLCSGVYFAKVNFESNSKLIKLIYLK
jgi:hypothetical protein